MENINKCLINVEKKVDKISATLARVFERQDMQEEKTDKIFKGFAK